MEEYGQREVCDLLFLDMVTGKPFLYMDYANTTTNDHSADIAYATGGRGGGRRHGWDSNRQSTLKVSTQIIDFRVIALLAGSEVVKGATNIFKREVLPGVDATGTVSITLSEVPKEGTVTVFPIASDAVAGDEETIVVVGSSVTITAGTEGSYACYYQFDSEATAEKISFKASGFPKYCKLIGDTVIKNSLGVNEPFQMVAGKCKPQAGFSFNMANSGDPATFDITFDLFASSTDDELISYVKYL